MNLKDAVLERGYSYLATHYDALRSPGVGMRAVTNVLAVVATTEEVCLAQRRNHIELNRVQFGRGNLDAASASLHLAAGFREGFKRQEKTLSRRKELVMGVAIGRKINAERAEQKIK